MYIKYYSAAFLKLCSMEYKFWKQLIYGLRVGHVADSSEKLCRPDQTSFMNMYSSQ